jgi:O-antigen/teichoic acid export membrane protein
VNNPTLARRVVSSSASLGAASVFGNVVRLAVIAFLARYLSASDFGVMGLAIVFAQLGQQVGIVGLDVYVIRTRHLAEEALNTVFWMALVCTTALATMWILGRCQIEAWFHAPGLAAYVVVISCAVVVSGIGVVPQSLLQKTLRYREFAIAESVGSVAQAIVGVVLALAHYGIWALIWGYFAQEAAKTTLFWWYAPFKPRLRWRSVEASAALRFALPVLGDRILTFLTLNSDRVIIGRLLGPGLLGLYVLAVEIVGFPARRVVAILARVLFPALSELQHDVARMAEAYRRVVRLLSLLTIPAFVGLGLVAHDLVSVLLGEQWIGVVVLIRGLSIMGVVTALLTPSGAVLYGRGRPGLAFYWSLLTAGVVPVAIVVGARWGLTFAALAHSLAWAMLLPLMVGIQARLLALPLRFLGREYAAGIGVAIPVLLAVVSAQALASYFGPSSASRLAVSVSAGLVSYVAAVWMLERPVLLNLRGGVLGIASLDSGGN